MWSAYYDHTYGILRYVNSNHYYHYHYYYYHPLSAGHITTSNILCTDHLPWLWKGKQNGVPSATVPQPVCICKQSLSFIYLLSDWCCVTAVAWQTNLVYHDVLNYYNFHHKLYAGDFDMLRKFLQASRTEQKYSKPTMTKVGWVQNLLKVLVINTWDQEITTQEMEITT